MRSLNRDSRVFFAVNLAFSLGMSMYSFVLPAYARQLGASPAQFGALVSGAFALGTLAVIPGGIWADRYDRRLLMLIGWGMCLPTPLLFAAATDWTWLIPGYLFFFLSFFCNPAINAYISAIADPNRMGAVWGIINSAFPLGFIVGPVLGAAIINSQGMRTVFFCAFACYLVSFGLLFLLRPQSARSLGDLPDLSAMVAKTAPDASAGRGRHAGDAGAPAAGWRHQLVRIAAVFAGFHLLAGIGQNYIALYLQDSAGLALSRIGVFGSASAMGGFIAGPLIGRLRDRRGTRLAISTSLGLVGLAYTGLLTVKMPAGLFAALSLRGGENGLFSLGQAEVAARSPRQELGRTFAAFNVMTGIGGTLGPYLGGLLYGLDARLPFLTVIVGCLTLAAVSQVITAPGKTPASSAPTPQVELAQGEPAV